MPSPAILAVLAAVMINMMGVGLVWPILPQLVAELAPGATPSQVALWYGSIAVVFSIMQFLCAPLLGALSDRFGRRPVMLFALLGLGLDNLLLAFAPSLAWMFVGRALGGMLGATMSVATAYMADVTEGKDRAGAFARIGAAFGVGFIIGPVLGGVLGSIDIRLPFLVAAGLSLANFAIGWFFLAETLPGEKRRARRWRELNPFGAFAWLASQPAILLLAVAFTIATVMQRGLESVWVLFSGVQYGWGPREAGLSLTVVGICFVVVQGFLVGPSVKRFGEMRVLIGGYALSTVMFVFIAFNTSGLLGYLGIIPHVLGWGMATPALQALASRQVDESSQGYLQGSLTALAGLSAILGPAMSNATFAFFISDAAPVAFPGAFFLIGSVFIAAATLTAIRARR